MAYLLKSRSKPVQQLLVPASSEEQQRRVRFFQESKRRKKCILGLIFREHANGNKLNPPGHLFGKGL
ncbi:Sec14p-like phosphatidylinositol transfer family protein [Zea mays]|uniref:Sec14p-like phosphatidylinositol transfer family protein n=1 Tax=Zea mays TaxID=4577 RepID=A0A1D6M0I5_MAIZE|nr:Sec14p-like phosphatidylinositol transfer family protein [Zea mays]